LKPWGHPRMRDENLSLPESRCDAMTWLQRYKLNSFFRSSIWLPPLLAWCGAAAAPTDPVGRPDPGWKSVVGPGQRRAPCLPRWRRPCHFIVFVFSILLLAVQLASAQLTPRNHRLRLSQSRPQILTDDLCLCVHLHAGSAESHRKVRCPRYRCGCPSTAASRPSASFFT